MNLSGLGATFSVGDSYARAQQAQQRKLQMKGEVQRQEAVAADQETDAATKATLARVGAGELSMDEAADALMGVNPEAAMSIRKQQTAERDMQRLARKDAFSQVKELTEGVDDKSFGAFLDLVDNIDEAHGTNIGDIVPRDFEAFKATQKVMGGAVERVGDLDQAVGVYERYIETYGEDHPMTKKAKRRVEGVIDQLDNAEMEMKAKFMKDFTPASVERYMATNGSSPLIPRQEAAEATALEKLQAARTRAQQRVASAKTPEEQKLAIKEHNEAEAQIQKQIRITGSTEEDMSLQGGITGSQQGKAETALREQKIAVEQMHQMASNTKDLLREQPEALTNVASATRIGRNLVAEGKALARATGVDVSGVAATADGYSGDWGPLATANRQVKQAAYGMAYALAITQNPDGRISNSDLESAIVQVGLTDSDAGIAANALDSLVARMEDNYRIAHKNILPGNVFGGFLHENESGDSSLDDPSLSRLQQLREKQGRGQ